MAKIKVKQITGGSAEGQVLVTDASGNNVWAQPTLGAPTDGDFTTPRYTGGKAPAVGLAGGVKVVDAIDSLNEVLGLLLPNPPADLSGATLALGSASTTALLVNGATNNSTNTAPTAGTSVTRVTTATINSTVIDDRGSGTAGTITLRKNGALVGGETLSFSDNEGDTKTSGALRITDNKWTSPPGFFQTFDTQIVGATVSTGINDFAVEHSVSGNTSLLTVVADDLVANPAVSNVTAVEATKSGVFSSGVEHYGSGSTFTVGAEATNLAGQTYKSGTILSLTGPGSAVNFAAGQAGLPSVLNANTLAFTMSGQTFQVGGNNKSRNARITVTASNVNGNGNAQSGTDLLVLSGTGGISDGSITGPATTSRIYLTDASKNTDTPSALTNSAWVSTQSLASVGYTHEAAIVGGVLRQDQTNYSVGYLPAGNPDYSSKDTAQYVTYKLSIAARSSLSIAITGSYAGLWIALPGISTTAQSPNAINGVWWNAFALYNGSGIPGRSGDTLAGCASGAAATGSNGTVNVTFGTASSTNSTGNEIYIRIKLNAGQSITALSIA